MPALYRPTPTIFDPTQPIEIDECPLADLDDAAIARLGADLHVAPLAGESADDYRARVAHVFDDDAAIDAAIVSANPQPARPFVLGGMKLGV